MKNSKVLVVFSGGQDSTTCLFKAIADYGRENVYAVTFSYGQRHVLEVEVASKIVAELGIAGHKVITIDWYQSITHNALFEKSGDFSKETAESKYPNSFVDGRNALFILMAAIYAKSLGIFDLMIGVGDADFSGYPDCREVFVKSMNETLNLAMDCEFRIHAPLQHLSKAATWALADELNALEYIRDKTLTCYNGVIGRGCGECPSCKLRSNGLTEYLTGKKESGDK